LARLRAEGAEDIPKWFRLQAGGCHGRALTPLSSHYVASLYFPPDPSGPPAPSRVQVQVSCRDSFSSPTGPDGLDSIFVRPPNVDPKPITTFVRFKPVSTLLSVNHQGQFPAVTLSFNLAPNVALGQAVDAIQKPRARIGLPASIRADFQGTARAFTQSFSTMPVLILGALLVVYIVLGVL
jgi:multidrug efflux pump subunit AcrB